MVQKFVIIIMCCTNKCMRSFKFVIHLLCSLYLDNYMDCSFNCINSTLQQAQQEYVIVIGSSSSTNVLASFTSYTRALRGEPTWLMTPVVGFSCCASTLWASTQLQSFNYFTLMCIHLTPAFGKLNVVHHDPVSSWLEPWDLAWRSQLLAPCCGLLLLFVYQGRWWPHCKFS